MTPTEKKYAVAIGELYEYNYYYWRSWEESQKENNIVLILIAGLKKDEYNGRYFYTATPIGDAPFQWMLPEFKISCSEFSSLSRTRPFIEKAG